MDNYSISNPHVPEKCRAIYVYVGQEPDFMLDVSVLHNVSILIAIIHVVFDLPLVLKAP